MRFAGIMGLLLSADLLIGGCSTYGFLPETDKVRQPVLDRPNQLDTIKAMRETAESHGTAAAKKIEDAR